MALMLKLMFNPLQNKSICCIINTPCRISAGCVFLCGVLFMNKVGVIGAGNMASAILFGLLKSGIVMKEHLSVSDKDEAKLAVFEREGIFTSADNSDIADRAEVVLIAVKPNIYPFVLDELKEYKGKVFVSIAPGISIDTIEQQLYSGAKIVRTMPNTPAQVNAGMTVLCKSGSVTEEEFSYVRKLFDTLGKTMELPEKLMSASVAVNGSGPAYVFMMIEAMADAAVLFGIPRKEAYQLAAQTVAGSAEMVLKTGKHPAELKDMVCSPGGTTIEAVSVFEEKGFGGVVIDAMKKCKEKAEGK